MAFIKIKISKLSHLVAIKKALEDSQKQWFYRGHANSQWQLLSTFERYFSNYKSKKTVGEIEKEMMRHFDCLNRKSPPYVTGRLDSLLRNSYLQHNGCATRLLDVTLDFYTACFFSLLNIGLHASGSTCCIWCFNQRHIIDFINASGYNTLYQDIAKYEIGFGQADQFFGTDFVNNKGVLLIGNLIDPDHQLEQNGRFMLALHTEIPTFKQLFDLYKINVEAVSDGPVVFPEEYCDSVLNDKDVLQLIIKDKALMVECEKLIIQDHNRTLKNLFPNGIKSEFADLNNLFKQ